MLCCVVLAISLGLVFVAPNYAGALYPDLCHDDMCRSPINLVSTNAYIHSPIQYRNYFNGHFNKFFKGALMNTGTTVVWTINPEHHFKLKGGKMWKWKNPSVSKGPFDGISHSHAYYFWKAEFRWGEPGVADKGSEHTIDGKQFPLEMQMVHIEDDFVGPDGSLNLAEARSAKQGIAILSILFKIDNKKPQNQEPLTAVDDKVWQMHWPGAHAGKRSLDLDLTEVEEHILERDHELNMRQLQYGFIQLKANETDREKRVISNFVKRYQKYLLTLNLGAFIRKAIRNGFGKRMSTYWTYKGSLTTPYCCDKSKWVDMRKDCGGCRALIRNMHTKYQTCENYCQTVGMDCLNAYEETDDTCVIEKQHACNDIVHGSLNFPSYDVICECTPKDDKGPETKNCKKYDVGFILDESGSINRNDWLKAQEFTNAIAQTVEIGINSGRASVMTFNDDALLRIRFDAHLNYKSFARAVDNLKQRRGITNIIGALDKALDDMFQTTNGMRKDSEKIAVLITDGKDSYRMKKYKQMADKYRQRKIKLFVIGIGSVDKKLLKKLVDDRDCYFHANNFNQLLNRLFWDVAENLQGACKVCEEAITWVVFQRVLSIAQVQANAFSSLFSNNWRPVQPTSAKCDVQHLIHNCLNCECKCY